MAKLPGNRLPIIANRLLRVFSVNGKAVFLLLSKSALKAALSYTYGRGLPLERALVAYSRWQRGCIVPSYCLNRMGLRLLLSRYARRASAVLIRRAFLFLRPPGKGLGAGICLRKGHNAHNR